MKLNTIFIIIIFFSLFSCFTRQNKIENDSWYSEDIPKSFHFDEKSTIPYFEIKEQYQSIYTKLLINVNYCEIPITSIDTVVKRKFILDNTKKYFAVRALYFTKSPGSYEVEIDSLKNILVYHCSLGKAVKKMNREVLIIALKVKPNNIYTQCFIDE